MPQLKVQNFYSTTITSDIVSLGDTSFTVAVAPTYTSGFLVLSPNNITLREIVYFHNVVGNTVSVRAENRGQGGTTAKLHTSSEPVAMKDIAEIFNVFSDSISQCFFVEKTGGLTIKVWGGTVFYNGNPVTVADTSLTLADNQTNYIKYSYPTNTISVDQTNSGNIKARVTTVAGVITGIQYYVAKESYIDFTVSITGALPSQAGNAGLSLITDGTNISWGINNNPRSGLGAAIGEFEIDATGLEVKRVRTAISSITSNSLITTIDPSTRARGEVAYSALKTDVIGSLSKQYIAGESLASGDAIGIEYFGEMCDGYGGFAVGNTTGQTRFYQQFIGSGVAMTTLTTPAVKSGSPIDNYILTIETDSAGVPSGILADANATSTLASSGFSAGWTDEVWTFGGSFMLTLGTKYHIVIKRSGGVDAVNYVNFTDKTRNTRLFGNGFYTGSSYAAAGFTSVLSCSGTGILKQCISKASASFIETANVIGFTNTAYAPGQTVTVSSILATTGLTDQKYYYLSNTPGAISLTAGTIKCVVGVAKGTTNLIYDKNIYNPFSQDSILLQFLSFSLTNSSISKDFIFKDYGKLQINVSGNGPRIIIRVDGVAFIDTTSSYTLQFEPNKIYSIVFAGGYGTTGTATHTLSRTYSFDHALLIY